MKLSVFDVLLIALFILILPAMMHSLVVLILFLVFLYFLSIIL